MRRAPSWTKSCPFSNDIPSVPLVYSNTETLDPGGDDRYRLILLDLGQADTALIDIEAVDPASFDSLVAQSMPIIETFHFR